MALGYTQLCQESADIGVVAGLPQLVNPAGTDAEGLGCKENVLQGAGTIHTGPPLVRLIGDNDQRGGMIVATISLAVSTLPCMEVVILGKDTFDFIVQLFQHLLILDGGKVPRLQMHTTGSIGSRLKDKVQIFCGNLLFRIGTDAAACLDGL